MYPCLTFNMQISAESWTQEKILSEIDEVTPGHRLDLPAWLLVVVELCDNARLMIISSEMTHSQP